MAFALSHVVLAFILGMLLSWAIIQERHMVVNLIWIIAILVMLVWLR